MKLQLALGAAIAALMVVACGGKVVVDKSGGGGTGATTTTGGGGEGGSTLCLATCAALQARGCAGADCAFQCESILSGTSCPATADALLGCLRDQAATAPSCFIEPCQQARSAHHACETSATSCESPLLGEGSPNLCVGKGICPGNVEHAAQCDASGHCDCLLGNGDVGQCQETGPFLCDMTDGCCGALFPQEG
ncbi:MAG: hypothetical protein QM820_31645 [Minicystis sp.]